MFQINVSQKAKCRIIVLCKQKLESVCGTPVPSISFLCIKLCVLVSGQPAVVTQHDIPGQPLVWWCCAQAACLTFSSDTNITVPSRCVLTPWCPVPSSSVVRAAHSSPQVCSDTLAGSMVQISPSLPMGGEFFPAGCRG